MHLARRYATLLAVALLFTLLASSSFAAPLTVLAGTYVVTGAPAVVGATTTTQIAVQVANTGDETWASSSPNPVDLSYHWYDASGTAVIWDGIRTPLGADVAPGGTRSVTASVTAPATAGVYTLRFALQPMNGDHLGVAPHREFLLVSPAAADTSVAPTGYQGTVDLSKQTTGAAHPAVWSLDPPAGASGEPFSITRNDAGHQGIVFEVTTSSGPVRFGLILIGKIEA